MHLLISLNNSVIPTKVGIQVAGFIDSRLRGNDGRFRVFIGSVLDSNDVFLIAEATGSRHGEHKNEAVARVRDAGAIVGSVEMFAFEALGSSKHPAFRTIQRVIV